jgi:hypothetical protein
MYGKVVLEVNDALWESTFRWEIKEVVARSLVLPQVPARRCLLVDLRTAEPKVLQMLAEKNVVSIVQRRHQDRDKPTILEFGAVRTVSEVLLKITVLRQHHNQWVDNLRNFYDALLLANPFHMFHITDDIPLANPGRSVNANPEHGLSPPG